MIIGACLSAVDFHITVIFLDKYVDGAYYVF